MRRVVFLHRAGHIRTGAKIMRCDQLSEMARARLGDRFTFTVQPLPRPKQERKQMKLAQALEGAIVIFLKRADLVLTAEAFAALKTRARALCIDYVDGDHRAPPPGPIDVAIAASLAGRDYLEDRVLGADWPAPQPALRLLHHHPDPRIPPRRQEQETRLRLAYFGARDNTVIPPNSAVDVACPTYDPATLGQEFFGAMAEANMHYAVRPGQKRGSRLEFKPFTKGFNAAAAGAAVLVNRQENDAEALLGEDYPFLLPDSSHETIAAGIERAHASFGGADWALALELMEPLRRISSPDAVVEALASIVGELEKD